MATVVDPPVAPSCPSERLRHLLEPLADLHGLRTLTDSLLFRPGTTDAVETTVAITRPAYLSARGVEGTAALIVDVAAPGSALARRVRFYELLDVHEVLLVNPDTRVASLLRRRGNVLTNRRPHLGRWLGLSSLDAWISVTALPTLRVRWQAL